MNDFDLDRLGELWREDPPAAESQWIREEALKTSRRARRAQLVETIAAALVAALVVALVAINPRLPTVVAGGAALLMLLSSQSRQRRLRAVELQSLTGSTEDMLDQSIARTRATLKRLRFSLIGIGPATLVGIAFGGLVDQRGGRPGLLDLLSRGWLLPLLLTILLLVTAHLLVSVRRTRRELERVEALRDTYRLEQEASESNQ